MMLVKPLIADTESVTVAATVFAAAAVAATAATHKCVRLQLVHQILLVGFLVFLGLLLLLGVRGEVVLFLLNLLLEIFLHDTGKEDLVIILHTNEVYFEIYLYMGHKT